MRRLFFLLAVMFLLRKPRIVSPGRGSPRCDAKGRKGAREWRYLSAGTEKTRTHTREPPLNHADISSRLLLPSIIFFSLILPPRPRSSCVLYGAAYSRSSLARIERLRRLDAFRGFRKIPLGSQLISQSRPGLPPLPSHFRSRFFRLPVFGSPS